MIASETPSVRRSRLGSHLRAAGFAAAASLVLLSGTATAQARADQVSWVDAAGRAKSWRGEIKENSLTRTVIESAGRDRNVDAAAVVSVEFGDVPPSYAEGSAYYDRADYENAAAKFQVAATDATARDVVKADARRRAGIAWSRRANADKSAFAQAKTQLELYLSEFPNDRAVPSARLLAARMTWLSGDAAGAVGLYRSLFAEVQGETATEGYPLAICYRAGLDGARAALASGDTSGARELYSAVANALASVVAGMDSEAAERRELENTHARAELGEGFGLLAAGDVSQAKTFFQGQLANAPYNGPKRFGARLGLGESLLAEGRLREAQIEFAQVSAMDHSGRDRVARALVGLAECAIKLSDANSRADAKRWLQTIQNQYGDTPSLLRASELSKSL